MAFFRCVWFPILTLLLVDIAHAEIKTDFLMDKAFEEQLPAPVKNFTRDFKGIWIQALKRPETDLQRMSAETIALAHQHGIPDLNEAVPALQKILVDPSSHLVARLAAARALIVLDSRESSENLLRMSQEHGADFRQLVEPVMAEWDVISVREIWLKRLVTKDTRHRDLILAIRGLGRVRESSALSALRTVAKDVIRGADIRLEAAIAAGQIVETGLEHDAGHLIHEAPTSRIVNRICAVHMLARHTDETSQKLLLELAVDSEPAVAAAALERLNSIDSSLVVPIAEGAMTSEDARVRIEGATAYIKLPTPSRMGPVAQLLDDPNPKLRKKICESLFQLVTNKELGQSIRDAAMIVLSRESWRGQEQAALLLGMLEHEPAGQRLIELLESPREEVMTVCAWSLRKIQSPPTIPAILDKLNRETEARKNASKPGLDNQVAHLFDACLQMKSKTVIPTMLKYVPKDQSMGERSRSAAVWGLGFFYEGTPDETLSQALVERATDTAFINPESSRVKRLAVVALARMKAVKHASAIKELYTGGAATPTSNAIFRWAIKEFTGEVLPEIEPSTYPQGSWFLEPLAP